MQRGLAEKDLEVQDSEVESLARCVAGRDWGRRCVWAFGD